MQTEVAHQAAPSITLPSRPAPSLSPNTTRESPLTLPTTSRASGTEPPAVTRPATLRLPGEVCPPEAHFRQTGVGSSSSKNAVGWTLARESEHEQVLLEARERRVQKLRGVRDFSMAPIHFVHIKPEHIECDIGCEERVVCERNLDPRRTTNPARFLGM